MVRTLAREVPQLNPMSLIESLIQLYERDLDKLKTEIGLYADEADLWKTSGEITNSAGNLMLHLIGNLKHFFGAVLGETGFVRDRDKEFSDGGVSRAEMLVEVDGSFVRSHGGRRNRSAPSVRQE